MLKYDLILMDADNTIYDFDAAEHNAILELLAWAGITVPDAPTVYSEYNRQLWQAYDRGQITQDALRVKRFELLVAHYHAEASPEECNERYSTLLGQQCIPLPGIEPVLRQIAQCLPIVVLTNGISVIQHSRFDRSPLSPLLSGMLVSEETGFPKPHPEMYWMAMERFGVTDRRRVLMIGDSLTSDITGANRAGVDACWFNPRRKPCSEDVHLDYEIHSLEEMPAVALARLD